MIYDAQRYALALSEISVLSVYYIRDLQIHKSLQIVIIETKNTLPNANIIKDEK